jgi:glycine cleavage system transcriptional repressor
MEKRFIMTVFGKDRPGIVAEISRLIYECGCNLEDSTMTRLAGEFVMMLLFSGRGELFEEHLLRECRRLEAEKGISASFRPLGKLESEREEAFTAHVLHLEGLDQAGIVYKISSYLAENNINILSLSSKLRHSPESGTALYTMEIRIRIPESLSLQRLDAGLDRVGDDLNVDITRSEES